MWVSGMAWFKKEKLPASRQIVSERWDCLLPTAKVEREIANGEVAQEDFEDLRD
jgi:hypothetical protein